MCVVHSRTNLLSKHKYRFLKKERLNLVQTTIDPPPFFLFVNINLIVFLFVICEFTTPSLVVGQTLSSPKFGP